MPKVSGTACTCENPVAAMTSTELGRGRKMTDRRGEVRIGAAVFRDGSAHQRKQVAEIPANTACESPVSAADQTREWRGVRQAAAPEPARQARAPAPPHCECRSRWSPRRTTRRSAGCAWRRRGSSRTDVPSCSSRTFERPSRSISPEKSTPTTDTGATRRVAAIARSAVPVHRSRTRVPGGSASASMARSRHRRSMPALST